MYQLLGDELFNELLLQAEKNPRKRSHQLLHRSAQAPVQQLCIAMQQDSYVRPHRHPEPNKWEQLVVLRGQVLLLLFTDSGAVHDRILLAQGTGDSALQILPNRWHSVVPISRTAVLLEIKEGPYIHDKHSEFAHWAPAEGSEIIDHFMQWQVNAKAGDCYR